MQKVYERILDMRGNLIVVKAKTVQLGEVASIHKRDGSVTYGSVLKFDKDLVTLQVFQNTRGIFTGDKVRFLNKQLWMTYSHSLLGRVLNSTGKPLDDGPEIIGREINVKPPSFNPVCRMVPNKMVRTNIPMIDMFNTLVRSQKIPIFSVPGEPYNALLMRISNQTDLDVVIIGGMGLRFDDFQAFLYNAQTSGTSDRTTMFIHQAIDPPVECVLVADMALAAAEKFALEGKSVLVLLTDMTAFADSLKEIAITMDQIPSNRGYPGSLYSDLAQRYEKAIDFDKGGSITIISVTTMPGNDVTHPIPDNTGYITEGQFYLYNGRIEPFGSLSRLKQMVIGKETREDHSDLANCMIRLYAEARKSKERVSMGFKVSEWDTKLISFAYDFENEMMSLDVNISIEEAIDLGWKILARHFSPQEVGIKKEFVDKYWFYKYEKKD